MIQDERASRIAFSAKPCELRLQSVTRGGEEVSLSVIESHLLLNLAVLCGQRRHQAKKECRVRHLVQRGWPGGERAVLYAQVSLTAGDAVAGSIPGPDRAIVQAKRRELRHFAALDDAQRVFVCVCNHNDAE